MSLTTTEWSMMILCKFLANANLHIHKNLQNIQIQLCWQLLWRSLQWQLWSLLLQRALSARIGLLHSKPVRMLQIQQPVLFFWHLAPKTQCSFSQLLTCWPGQPQKKCQQRLDAFLTGTDCPAPGWLPWKSIRCSSRESQLPQY